MNIVKRRPRARVFPALLPLLALTLAAASAVSAAPADPGREVPGGSPVTRHFANAGDLQIHYRRAAPPAATGHRPVVCLHQSPNSSQVYVEFLSELGRDRLALAPDTPGYGESDIPPRQPEIADFAGYMEAFAASLELGEVDVVGYHTGASVAVEWALRHPERIAHLVLVGVPAFTPEEVERFSSAPWPTPEPLSEAMLVREWTGSKSWQGQGQSDRSVERTFLAKIGAGQTGWWGPAAVFRYPLVERLAATRQPLTLVRANDDLWEATARARAARPDAEFVEVPEYKFAVFEAAPERMAAIVRARVDGGADGAHGEAP
ncbi:MAG: alpha/beta hydrolase [Gammaproteobacteria bacterium]